jgi:cell shape-determining protein MreC
MALKKNHLILTILSYVIFIISTSLSRTKSGVIEYSITLTLTIIEFIQIIFYTIYIILSNYFEKRNEFQVLRQNEDPNEETEVIINEENRIENVILFLKKGR